MNCPKCSANIDEKYKFCPGCGFMINIPNESGLEMKEEPVRRKKYLIPIISITLVGVLLLSFIVHFLFSNPIHGVNHIKLTTPEGETYDLHVNYDLENKTASLSYDDYEMRYCFLSNMLCAEEYKYKSADKYINAIHADSWGEDFDIKLYYAQCEMIKQGFINKIVLSEEERIEFEVKDNLVRSMTWIRNNSEEEERAKCEYVYDKKGHLIAIRGDSDFFSNPIQLEYDNQDRLIQKRRNDDSNCIVTERYSYDEENRATYMEASWKEESEDKYFSCSAQYYDEGFDLTFYPSEDIDVMVYETFNFNEDGNLCISYYEEGESFSNIEMSFTELK